MTDNQLINRLGEMLADVKDTRKALAVGTNWKDQRKVTRCACRAPTLGKMCAACTRELRKKEGKL